MMAADRHNLVRGIHFAQEHHDDPSHTIDDQLFTANPAASGYFRECVPHIRNAGRCRFLGAYKGEIPITAFDPDPRSTHRSTYVTSTQAHYVDYAWDEVLFHANSILIRGIALILLGFVRVLCRVSNVDASDVCFFNNSLVSTNLYKDERDVADNMSAITKELHSLGMNIVIFRCIERVRTPTLKVALESDPNTVFIASRIISQFDSFDESVWQKKNTQRDWKVLAKHIGANREEMLDVLDGKRTMQSVIERCTKESLKSSHILHVIGPGEEDGVYKRLETLYAGLYLTKYSTCNPNYSAAFFKHVAPLWTIMALQRRSDGLIEGFMCMTEVGGSVTSPALGYDSESETPTYVIMQIWTILEALSRRTWLNMSGGVSEYKERRGAVPVLEYSGVWIAPGTPLRRRLFWYFMNLITALARPILKRRKNVY